MPVIEEISGTFDVARCMKAIKQVVNRHEAFRTSFELRDEKTVQIIHEEVDLPIEYQEADEEEAKNIVNHFIRPFDLAKAPLLRVGIIKISNEKHILMIDMHHIISDGLSMDVFVKEFLLLYQGETLEPLKLQYKDYCAWQNELLNSEQMRTQEKILA